jgi:tetratricopeptide (TPR) repeat protein
MPIIVPTSDNSFLPAPARVAAPYLVLALAVFAAYSNVFDNVFLFDDNLIIQFNTYMEGWGHIGDILTGSTTSGVHIVGGFYRPLQILLYLFAFHLGNGTPFWFHALNLALHIANTCFVYRLGTKLGFDAKAVFLAALIWGVHPLHTEAVTYMSATADPLFAFFCLWGILVLLPDFTPRKILKVIPLFLLGIASKETAVMFPLLTMACLFYVSPQRLSPRTYFRTWPLWVIAIAYAYWRAHTPGFDGPQTYGRFYAIPSFADLKAYANEPLYRIYTFLTTLPQYLQLLIWPTHLHMERSFPIQANLWSWFVASGIFMIVFACGHLIYSCRKNRWLEMSWGFLWFAAAHAPDTGLLIPMNALFLEHWMYLPSVGLFLGLAQTLVALSKDRSRAWLRTGAVAALVFAFAMAIKTYDQNKIWNNPVSFYTNIFLNGEKSARAHNNLALYYSEHEQDDDAINEFNQAIAISDAYAETRYNLALSYLHKSQDKETVAKAIENLRRSLEIQPNFYRSYKALGDVYNIVLHDKKTADSYYARANVLFNERQ